MSSTSPNLNLPFIAPSQAMKHVTHNEALQRLDVLTQMAVQAFDVTDPPVTPDEGACFGVGVGATGAWAGQDGTLAFFANGGWQFLAPQAGWRAWDVAQFSLQIFDGTQWDAATTDLDQVDGIGINASHDATNRLVVSSAASLFNNAGSGHQIKVNKATASDTASLLFQNGFSGRAEMGLAGDDDFTVKVSADGSAFSTALKVRASDGCTDFSSVRSGRVFVAQDAAVSVPTPGVGGVVVIAWVDPSAPQTTHSGMFAFDTGATGQLTTLAAGPDMENAGTLELTGSAGTLGATSVSSFGGALQIENRFTQDAYYSFTFLSVY